MIVQLLFFMWRLFARRDKIDCVYETLSIRWEEKGRR